MKYMQAVEKLRRTGHTGFTKTIVASPQSDSENKIDAKQEEDHVSMQIRDDIIEALKNIRSEDGKTPEVIILFFFFLFISNRPILFES